MKQEYNYKWLTQNLADYSRRVGEDNKGNARGWLYSWDVDVPEITEGERLNFMLAVIKWEVERGCISEPVEDELYLYYEQLTKGELDGIIDPEEREEVVKDLTDCFNKVFPEGQ